MTPDVVKEVEQLAEQLDRAAEADPELKMTMLLERAARTLRALLRLSEAKP